LAKETAAADDRERKDEGIGWYRLSVRPAAAGSSIVERRG